MCNSIVSSWKVTALRPEEMLIAGEIANKFFQYGTIAGSVGRVINKNKKPGINEDGGLVAVNQDFVLTLTVDGHFGRDTTEIMINTLDELLKSQKISFKYESPPEYIFNVFHKFSTDLVEILALQNAIGEASYDLTLINLSSYTMHYYSVGDLMIFVHDDHRGWGHSFQISNRHFYEWINAEQLMGYHFGKIQLNPGSQILAISDGIIDEPVVQTKKIDELFHMKPFRAVDFVKYALDHNDEDDNITCICITVP